MSKTYRRTYKGNKRDWLPGISKTDLDGGLKWGFRFNPDFKKKEWIEKNPHRKSDVEDFFYTGYFKEPGWWIREMMTVPARNKQRALLQLVKLGKVDPEDITWPDNKKPHIYYW